MNKIPEREFRELRKLARGEQVPYRVEWFYSESVMSSGNIEPSPRSLGGFEEIIKVFPGISYDPNRDLNTLRCRLRRPRSTLSIFHSGKVTINARTESETKRAVRKFKRIFKSSFGKPFKIDYEIRNVVGSGKLNQGIECGALGALFPNSKKAWGEGHRVYLKDSKANFVYYPSGKVVGTGFKSYEEMKAELDNQIEMINENLNVIEKARNEVCFLERTKPTILSYYDFIKKAAENHVATFTTEQRLKGRYYLERFLDEKAKRKENLGSNPESIAAGGLYLLAESIPSINPRHRGKKLPLRQVSDITDLTEETIKRARNIILETVGPLA